PLCDTRRSTSHDRTHRHYRYTLPCASTRRRSCNTTGTEGSSSTCCGSCVKLSFAANDCYSGELPHFTSQLERAFSAERAKFVLSQKQFHIVAASEHDGPVSCLPGTPTRRCPENANHFEVEPRTFPV